MLDSSILQLYQNALENDMIQYNVPDEAVRVCIEALSHVYKPDTVSLNAGRSMVADYDDVAHRCAYLHKYAALHTAMVRDMLFEAIDSDFSFFSNWVRNERNFEICSLGGGPGSDVIGVISALHRAFSFLPERATVVDYMFNWSYSFDSILRELGNGWYGPFGQYMCFGLTTRYVAANLLKSLTPEVIEALSGASLVTMIKFASAAACVDTEYMLQNIFSAMKPGGMLLFIDNDGGGFHQLFKDAVIKYNFISIYGPHRHKEYINSHMRIKKFGFQSCCKTTVTVHMVKKPYCFNPSPYYYVDENRNIPLLPSPPTPMLFQPYPAPIRSPLESPPDYNFAIDENIACNAGQNDFVSPKDDIPQSPRNLDNRQVVATPSGPGKWRRKNPVKRFRHHLTVKFGKIKSQVSKVFKSKKSGKYHPIFRL